MPLETLSPTLAPSSSGAAPSINTPASDPGKIGAVSQAISQAVPPGQRSNQQADTRQTSTVREVSANNNLQGEDKEIGLEDFDTDSAPINRKVELKPATQVKQSTQEEGSNSKNEEVENNTTQDNKLELKINLDENADLTKEQQVEQNNNQNKGKRDYSKYKPEHQEYLKKLPNHLFAKAAEEFTKYYTLEQENSKLKEQVKNSSIGKLPENYYEHEKAYQLSPDYSTLSKELEYDNFESSHWLAQLANIKRGQPWINLKGYDPKSGQPVFEKIDPVKDSEGNIILDVENELRVQSNLHKVSDLTKEHNGKLTQLQQQHKLEYQQSREGLNGLKQQFFSAFSDESKLPPVVKADLQIAKEAIQSQLPAFRNNPMGELLSYSYAALKAQNRQILKLAQMLNLEKNKQENTQRAGPGKLEFQGGSASAGDRILDAKEFEDN